MSPKQTNPISLTALWHNFWVFLLYGLGSSLVTAAMSSFRLDLAGIEKIMMEPLSVYAFSILSIIGLFSLGIANVTVATTATQMKESPWVNRIWLPIANTGLATGAIVMGMMLGVAGGMGIYALFDPEAKKLAQIMLALSLYVLALLYPLVWMKRGMFDESVVEKKVTTYAGLIYCASLGVVFWLVDKAAFWKVIAGLILASVVIGGFIHYSARKKRG